MFESRLLAPCLLSLCAATAHADGIPVSIAYDQALYEVNQQVTLTISAAPGTLVFVGFDVDPGPTVVPGLGSIDLGFGPLAFFEAVVTGLDGNAQIVDANFGCLRLLAIATLYTQAASYDFATQTFCLSNPTVLLVEDPNNVCSGGGQPNGCTPGYWKNHESQWAETPYAPGDDFDTVFGVDFLDPNETLHQVASLGQLGAFGAHYVAALLNASHPGTNYPLSEAEVLAQVQQALLAGDTDTLESLKDVLEAFNEAGCPF